jgi:hypothetical protein
MTDTADTSDPLVGNILDGRYLLQRMLGRGGMGCVYGAEHVGIGRPVAIKVLDPQLVGDGTARKRFEREAQSTGKLRHPNCVGVTDFGAMPDGSPYLAMELVDGVTLEHVLDVRGKLPLARAVHIISHVLRGLAHAHAQGVVHRDLKPCNIMLVTEGNDGDFAKILDFGLARLVNGGGDRLTQIGVVCGTPRYMAPEQVLDGVIDPRVDLYAASVIFCEMLTGHTPFESDEPLKILRMHLKDAPPRIAQLAPDLAIPPAIDDLIQRGLAKEPGDRPATAARYLDELDRATNHAAPPAEVQRPLRLPSTVARLATMPAARSGLGRRRQLQLVSAAVAVLVIAVVIIVASRGDGGATTTAPGVATSAQEAEPEIEMPPSTVRHAAIDDALRLARNGRGQDATTRLKALRRTRPDDAQVPYALGRVYDGLGWPRQTVESYRDAIKLDPALRSDPALIRDLIDLLDSRSTWQLAARTLEHDVGAPAIPALDAVQARGTPTVRERAARIRSKLK